MMVWGHPSQWCERKNSLHVLQVLSNDSRRKLSEGSEWFSQCCAVWSQCSHIRHWDRGGRADNKAESRLSSTVKELGALLRNHKAGAGGTVRSSLERHRLGYIRWAGGGKGREGLWDVPLLVVVKPEQRWWKWGRGNKSENAPGSKWRV